MPIHPTKRKVTTRLALPVTLALTVILTGCELVVDEGAGPVVVDERQARFFDGVKLIDAGLRDGDDPATFRQERYRLGPAARLLLRLEELEKYLEQMRTESGYRVEILLTPASESDPTRAREALRVCPLTANWMMLATWRRAHPGTRGRWEREGGDHREAECVRPTIDTDSNRRLVFDVTSWLVTYPRGRQQNFGLIVLADEPVTLAGDTAGSDAPVIQWLRSTLNPRPRPTASPTPSPTMTPTPTPSSTRRP